MSSRNLTQGIAWPAVHQELLENALARGKRVRISATGQSMTPLIQPGVPLELEECRPENLRQGDIIVVRADHALVIHRLVRIEECPDSLSGLKFVTRGDAAAQVDPAWEKERVIAKVRACGGNFFGRMLWKILDSAWKRLPAGFPFPSRLIRFLFRRILGGERRLRNNFSKIRVQILNPAIHVLEIAPETWREDIAEAWNLSFAEPRFEDPEDLRKHLFSHPLAENPMVFAAVRKNRVCGFIAGMRGFPLRQGRRTASLEAMALLPAWRRRGMAFLLFQKLAGKLRREKIASLDICRNVLFFPGLDPERHDSALQFFLRCGVLQSRWTEEMACRINWYKRPSALSRIERMCRKDGISFERLGPRHREGLMRFFATAELAHRFKDSLSDHAPLKREIFLAALRNGEPVGVMHLVPASDFGGMASRFRAQRWSGVLECSPENLWIASHFILRRELRNRGIGSRLFAASLEWVFSSGGAAVIGDTSHLSNHHRRFGFRTLAKALYATVLGIP
jgi:signal peptidase I